MSNFEQSPNDSAASPPPDEMLTEQAQFEQVQAARKVAEEQATVTRLREFNEESADMEALRKNFDNSAASISSSIPKPLVNFIDKVRGVKEVTPMDIMHQDALNEDNARKSSAEKDASVGEVQS